MLSIEDLFSCKRENENFTYSNKLKKTGMNMINTSGFVEVTSSYSHKIVWHYAKDINNLSNHKHLLNFIKSELIEKLRDSACIHPIKFNFKLGYIQ